MAITLTIDGREVVARPGATILEAARQAGIQIPTLCHMDGLEHWTSCFLCVVQVDGRPNLTPACVAPAEDGMVVTTDSDDIRAARRTALELLLSDHRGDCVAPCSMACPAGLDIPGFIGHILAGDYRAAVVLIKDTIPLPGALGRVCPRYCERVCRRRESEEAIAICALKRFAADADLASPEPYVPARQAATGKQVAVVGAGPAGLSATFYLLREGHACTVYDSHRKPGGMLRVGIPEFRLPGAVLDGEIEVIRRMGAEFRPSCTVGSDVGLDELRRDYDAVFLAVGAQADGPAEFEGAGLCVPVLQFLEQIAWGGRPDVGDTVIVAGGGNEAVDAARTAAALGARTTIVWDKDRGSMPCFRDLVDAAEQEGVRLQLGAQPVRVENGADGRLRLVCSGSGGEVCLNASCIIAAPQRRVDVERIGALGLAVSERGVQTDRKTFSTDLDGVFAGGDAVTGPATAVRAVAAGRLAAVRINRYLAGRPVEAEPRPFNVRMGRLSEDDRSELLRGVECRARVEQPRLRVPDANRGFGEVEQGLSEEQARYEAARCLQCDCLARDDCKLRIYSAEYGASPTRFRGEPRPFTRNDTSDEIVFEPGKCILCGLCVRIAASRGERLGVGFSRRGFGTHIAVPFGAPLKEGLTTTRRPCVEACPTGALALRRPSPVPVDGSGSERAAGPKVMA